MMERTIADHEIKGGSSERQFLRIGDQKCQIIQRVPLLAFPGHKDERGRDIYAHDAFRVAGQQNSQAARTTANIQRYSVIYRGQLPEP